MEEKEISSSCKCVNCGEKIKEGQKIYTPSYYVFNENWQNDIYCSLECFKEFLIYSADEISDISTAVFEEEENDDSDDLHNEWVLRH